MNRLFDRLFAFLPLLCFLYYFPLRAQSVKTYTANATVPIYDNDAVRARKTAFSRLQEILIYEKALKELVEDKVREEYETLIRTKSGLAPSAYIQSVKVLTEKSSGINFFMKLQGNVHLDFLRKQLQKMGVSLKDDPWHNVTFLVQGHNRLQKSKVTDRIKIFHLKVTKADTLDSDDEKYLAPTLAPETVGEVFEEFPSNSIILLLQFAKEEKDMNADGGEGTIKREMITKMTLKVLRKPDNKQLNSFQLKSRDGVDPKKIWESEEFEKFLEQFSARSLKVATYDQGTKDSIQIAVKGLDNPYYRKLFETKILASNRRVIRSYRMSSLKNGEVAYELFIKGSQTKLIRALNKEKDAVSVEAVATEEPGTIAVQAKFGDQRTTVPLTLWAEDLTVLNSIREALKQEYLSKEMVPSFSEKEPNDNIWNVNRLESEKLVLGNISSRSDEDLYEIDNPEKRTILEFFWLILGRTRLHPEIKLYDEHFNFLNSYRWTGFKGSKFTYVFNGEPSAKIYIRISDQIGFIRRETGGYRFYKYLLKASIEATAPEAESTANAN